jgi:hypothetical protein
LFLSGYTNFPFGGYFPEWMLAPSNILAELAIPLAIGYAIVRHRVFDIEFVANRTIVFGTLGVIGILLFAGLDWLSANVLPDSKTSVATALAVAVTFGYAAARKFSALSALVDRVMFPRRYCSGVRLHELRVAIESQNDGSQTLQTLVGGVCKALGLASAAVFRASSDGGFVREYAAGWPSGSTWHLLSTDRIVHDTLAATDKPLRVRDQWASGTRVPQGFARPILCCPIGNHGRRIALVFYSSHTDGSEIDPDEARALMKLCNVYGRDALM